MARKRKKKGAKQPERDTKVGFSADESFEKQEAESMKSYSGESMEIQYQNRKGDIIETFDSKTGKKEGEITLGSQGAKGKFVMLEVVEKTENHYEFNAEEDIEEDRKTSGVFKVKNPSDSDKIWDIDITFKKDKPVDLDDEIHIKNLDPNGEQEFEYKIEQFEEPAMKVTEFISTVNDENILSYSLSTGDKNVVLFKVIVKNLLDNPLTNVVIKKEIQSGYTDVNVLSSSIGSVDNDSEFVEWKIDNLPANAEVELKLNMSIEIEDSSSKVRSGKISAEYSSPDKALTGLEIDKFDAYSSNFVGVLEEQKDDNPDAYDCSVLFINESDFQVQLVNLDVKNAVTGDKVIDIDPNEIPVLAAGASWTSEPWETETDDGLEPRFLKTVEFFLIASRKVSTLGTISIDDFELAVAAIAGKLKYSIEQISSYKITPFDVLLEAKNTGGADLNEITFEDTIQEGYIPPKPEEIEIYIVKDHEADFEGEETDWENLGDPIDIDSDLIEITPNDQEPENEHVLRIKLTDLKDHAMGMFLPNMIIRAKYPIQAYKPARDTEFVSNVRYIANTYPAGAPIELVPAPEVRIPIVHLRRKVLKGKKIHALATEGEYEIILTVKNTGDTFIENVEMRDVVPDNFEYGDYSFDPASTDNLEGKDLLIWKIDRIEANDEFEITYKITGKGDYKASDSQLSA
ncbi:MAG: hypothetical protein ACTSWX_12845 [Promethearchaeota archaeon]